VTEDSRDQFDSEPSGWSTFWLLLVIAAVLTVALSPSIS